VRESTQSWRELLLDLKRRGLSIGPELAVADGAPGFWQALEEVWPQTRGQRCWVHKTANFLNKLPNSQQRKAKRALQEIWMAETKKDALAAFDAFVEAWGVKYDKAVGCLIKDRDALLAFYDFPAEHWKHLRTTDVVESSFATVRHRTVRSKGSLSNKTALAMIFKLGSHPGNPGVTCSHLQTERKAAFIGGIRNESLAGFLARSADSHPQTECKTAFIGGIRKESLAGFLARSAGLHR
jgi:transposase-like protein